MALDFDDLLARARDASTPGPDLERIGAAVRAPPRHAADPRAAAVLAAVASNPKNPNAPPALLLALAPSFAEHVASNPALALLPLEDPSFVTSAASAGLEALLRRPELPREWFEFAARHPFVRVRAEVASSTRAPAGALARLAHDSDGIVRCALAANPSAPP
jgi:hypothetical protein